MASTVRRDLVYMESYSQIEDRLREYVEFLRSHDDVAVPAQEILDMSPGTA